MQAAGCDEAEDAGIYTVDEVGGRILGVQLGHISGEEECDRQIGSASCAGSVVHNARRCQSTSVGYASADQAFIMTSQALSHIITTEDCPLHRRMS